MTELSRRIKKALDAIELRGRPSFEELQQGKVDIAYTYHQSIAKYGVNAVTCIWLFRQAGERITSVDTLDQFLKKYELTFDAEYSDVSHGSGFSASIESIQADGLFIPLSSYSWRDTISYFNYDDVNILYFGDQVDGMNIAKQRQKKWQRHDFMDTKMIERGLRYARDLWHSSCRSYEKYRFTSHHWIRPFNEEELKEARKIDRLVQKLIAYYNKTIEAAVQ